MLNILVITDYKLSSLNQCNSIINELKKTLKKKLIIKYMKVELGLLGYLPNILIYFFLRIRYLFKSPQKIDFIISCGRISAPFNLVFKKINSAKNCHILNPYFRKSEFDKIIIPKHDIKKKIDENVITTFGTLVDLTKFKKECRRVYKYLDNKKKKISFFIGGNGKSSKIMFNELDNTIEKLNLLSKEYEVIYCFSRRTPSYIKNMIMQKASKNNHFFPKKEVNPYWFLLNISEYIFVTADSISMISDSLSTGKKVYIVPIKKIKTKIKKFTKIILEKKMAKVSNGKLENWKYKKLCESNKVCKKIIKALQL